MQRCSASATFNAVHRCAVLVPSRGRHGGSSKDWLRRQAADPAVIEARKRGLRSRAALKLEEMDRELRLFQPHMTVVDLGASPGSWCQMAVTRIGLGGRVVAADLLPIEPLDCVTVLKMDLTAADAIERIRAALGPGSAADVVLNDMAPNTSGISSLDHWKSIALCEVGLDVALAVLLPGGSLISKVFMGGGETELRVRLGLHFAKVKVLKPASSRKESREVYIAAMSFKGK